MQSSEGKGVRRKLADRDRISSGQPEALLNVSWAILTTRKQRENQTDMN
jgi:hypothetical protein